MFLFYALSSYIVKAELLERMKRGKQMRYFTKKRSLDLYKTQKREAPSGWLLFFLVGFFAGVIWVYLKADYFFDDSLFFGEDLLNRISYTSFHSKQYFAFLLQRRMSVVIFLLLMSTTAIGIVIMYLFVAWFGFSLGVLLGVVTLKYGVKGILIFLITLIPQVFIYVPAYFAMLQIFRILCMLLYYPGKLARQKGFESYLQRNEGFKKKQLVKMLIIFIALIGVVIIGIFIESYVNPYLMRKFLRNFI